MPSRHTRTASIVLACSALLGAGTWAVRSGHLGGHSKHTALAPKPATVPGTWKEGERRQYALDLTTSLGTDAQGTILALSLGGKWTLQAVNVGPDAVLLAATIDVARFEADGAQGKGKVDTAEMKAAFAKPFFFVLDEHGLVLSTRGDPATPGLVEGVVRSLVGYMQLDVRARAATRYPATEVDSSGRYEAVYERHPDGVVTKTKQRYLEILGASGQVPGEKPETDVLQSTATYGFDGERVARLTLEEHLTVRGGQLPLMHSRTSLSLTLEAAAPGCDAGALAALASRRDALPLYARTSTRADLARMHDQRAAGYDTATLLKKLRALGPKDEKQRAELYSSASDLLRADPSSIPGVLAEIHKSEKDRVFLITALGAAGSAAAQSALSGLYDEHAFNANTQRDIVRSLAFVDEPSENTVEKLSALVDDPLMGRQAKFGLGTAANHLKAREPERAAQIVAFLEQGLKESDDASEKINYLKALGNGGMEPAIDMIVEQLGSSSLATRTEALRALRLMPEGRADDILARQMLSEGDFEVRATAIRTIERRTPTEVVGKALFQLIQTEQASMPRAEVYKALLSWSSDAPYVKQALEWARENEQDPKLRAKLDGSG